MEAGDNITITEDGNKLIISSSGGGLALQSISIKTPPDKTAYFAGESFDPTGMVVEADYGRGIKQEVTGYTVSPAGAMAAGTEKVTVSYAEGGITAAAEQAVTVTKRSLAVPVQAQSITYTGAVQSPTWTGYDSAFMTMGGTTSATNAGSYQATFSLKDPQTAQWADGTVEDKTAAWTITKTAGSLSLDKTGLSLTAETPTGTIKATWVGDGTLSAQSSNTAVATVSVAGDTITVTAAANGSAKITVSVSEGTNHLTPAAAEAMVTAAFVQVYGASWDGTATTAWSRTDAAASFTDPVPYVAGASSYGSPFDNLRPWSGMVRSERAGGSMVAIPKFWYKITQSGKSIKIQIADAATEGFHVSPAHMNRGDGNGERDTVYIGRYHCGSNFKSATGQSPKNNVTRANFRTSIHALGTNIWQSDFAMRFTIWLLYIVEFADWNSQAKIGKGCGNNSGVQNMGYTDNMPYHTGTTQSNRDTYGLGTQYRNIEGLWDNVYDWCDGCYNNASGLNIILNPNNFSDSAGGTPAGVPTTGWPSAFTKTEAGGFPMFIPSESNGGETIASCDYWNFNVTNPVIYVGGSYGRYGSRGLFCVDCTSATSASAYLGSRLQELP